MAAEQMPKNAPIPACAFKVRRRRPANPRDDRSFVFRPSAAQHHCPGGAGLASVDQRLRRLDEHREMNMRQERELQIIGQSCGEIGGNQV